MPKALTSPEARRHEIAVCRVILNLSQKQTAKKLGIHVNTVKYHDAIRKAQSPAK